MFTFTRNSTVPATVAVLAAMFMTTTAFAGNVHLRGGKKAAPSFNDLGLTLEAMGSVAGVGNGDILFTLEASADAVSTCTNPGGTAAPGQNPAAITVSGSEAVPESAIKNGAAPFDLTTVAPVTIVPDAPDCPNSSWSEAITDLEFTSATIIVEQPVGTEVLVIDCTIDPPTENGAVRSRDVRCTQH